LAAAADTPEEMQRKKDAADSKDAQSAVPKVQETSSAGRPSTIHQPPAE